LSINLSHIELADINKRYKNAKVDSLKDVSFTIKAGDKVGILGPNGAGKTTLISILCGLIKPTNGGIIYKNDQNTDIKGSDLKKIIGFVPQEYAFYHELTPAQNLSYFGALYNIPTKVIKERTNHLLSILGILNVAHKKVSTFSGGMKRKVNLAIGLIHQPEILFLDEPTVGVDVQSKIVIIDFLNEINSKGTTIIYSSHHLSEAEDFCDSMLMLNNGSIIAEGKTKELIHLNNTNNLQELFIKLSESN
jgi:ABC-2 type transport system ATP-binding protein